MTIAYDGTHYGGWQIQSNTLSIQEVIEQVLFRLTQQQIPTIVSGRTDAGVHANGQVAHFESEKSISLKSLNSLLPPDIRILSLEEVDPSFHARFSVKEKIYRYHFCTSRVQSPFERGYTLHCLYPLNREEITSASTHFIGTHDFTSFANELDPRRDPVKTLFELSLIPTSSGFTLKFRGNGFLYKMVRNITGTLIDIGRGKLSEKCIPELLALKSRHKLSTTAPPHGLFLDSVVY